MTSRQAIDAAKAVQPNLLDKAIGYFNPQSGLSRLQARQVTALIGGYTGATKGRRSLQEWSPYGYDADTDILGDLDTLRNRSRDLVRNSPLACGAIHTKVTSVVGTGLVYQSKIDRKTLGLTEDQADEWEASAEREFSRWAESPECDVERTLNFYEIQDLVFRSTLESGDVFCPLPMISRPGSDFEQKIQVIEADRVSNPDNAMDTASISGGVERDLNGAPVAYHILKQHPGAIMGGSVGEWDRFEAFGAKTGRKNIIHLYRKMRPGQSRGVPDLAPVIEKIKQITRYAESEINAAVIASFYTVFIKNAGGGMGPMGPTSETGAKESDEDIKMASGAIVELGKDEEIQIADPSRPNTAFDPFVLAITREIGVALEIPFELMVKHFTASFSAAQAALLEAWRAFMTRRKWLSSGLCQPVVEAVLMEAVLKGRLVAPGFVENHAIRAAYLKADWIGPARGSIREDIAIKAATARIDAELSTRADEAASLGKDWLSNNAQRRKEENARVKDEPIIASS